MQTIDQFKLKNSGGIVVRIYCEYRNLATGKWTKVKCTEDITLGFSKTVELGEHGVPDGASVKFIAFVVSGADNTYDDEFIYKRGCNTVAQFKIKGTTLINKLEYQGIFNPANSNMSDAAVDTLDEEEVPVVSIPRALTAEEWAGLEAAYKLSSSSQNENNEPIN